MQNTEHATRRTWRVNVHKNFYRSSFGVKSHPASSGTERDVKLGEEGEGVRVRCLREPARWIQRPAWRGHPRLWPGAFWHSICRGKQYPKGERGHQRCPCARVYRLQGFGLPLLGRLPDPFLDTDLYSGRNLQNLGSHGDATAWTNRFGTLVREPWVSIGSLCDWWWE